MSGRFSAGDLVHVASFGKGIVRDVRRGGRYLVEVKGRSMLVGDAQLSPVEPKKRRATGVVDTPSSQAADPSSRADVSTAIDLHGMTAEEAVAAVDAFLSDAILAGHPEVRVIHGRSGGRLKAAVQQRLKQLPSVVGFRLDPANPGVTIVCL